MGCEEGELSPEAAWEVVEEVEGDADVGNVVAPGAGRVGVFELEWHGQGVSLLLMLRSRMGILLRGC